MRGSTQIKVASISLQSSACHKNFPGKTSTNCLTLLDQNSANFQMLAKATVLGLTKQLIDMIALVVLICEK